jgi:nucleoside-diphosphate-sugar epimerase
MTIQHLELTFAATRFTPQTTLFYRSEGPSGEVSEARVTVGGKAAMKQAEADIYELAFRYRQKRVSRAVLRVGNTIYEDSDGDGRLEIRDGEVLAQRPLATEVMVPSPALNRALSLERLHDIEPNRSGKWALAGAEVKPVVGSIEDATSWEAVARRCEVLIHCAVQYTSRMFEFDRRAVSALLGIASGTRESCTFIYTSGVWLYGDTAGTVVDEESPVNPAELVRERVEIEDSVLATRRDGLRPIVIRVGCVYGASGSLTATWFDTAQKHGSARIVGDGSNRWAMVHVQDLADLYLRAAESDASGEVFNATDRSRSTVFECARAASFAAGAKGRVEKVSLETGAQGDGS